jgi:anthranilate phosphoribosyltransferase
MSVETPVSALNVPACLQQACRQQPFSESQAEDLMRALICDSLSPAVVAALLGALATRPPTVAELTGFARVLRQQMQPVSLPEGPTFAQTLDTCGTGGDGGQSFNVSTAVALLVAAAGLPVLKHGNRSVSSRSGSADVLAALGLNTARHQQAASVQADLQQHGIGFCFAPAFHPALKAVAPVRQALGAQGLRTVFNLLGPLCNPARVTVQVLGVFDPQLTDVLAAVLHKLGTRSALVVSAEGVQGLDEISLAGPTRCSRLSQGRIQSLQIRPQDLGLQPAPLSAVRGGDAAFNARLIEGIFAGQVQGPPRDLVCLNAAAAFWTAEASASLSEGLQLARTTLDSGKALTLLQALRQSHHPVPTSGEAQHV